MGKKLLVFVRGSRRAVILRPETYKDAIEAAKDLFNISSSYGELILKTKDLEICEDKLVEITPETWNVVCEEARAVEVIDKYDVLPCKFASSPEPSIHVVVETVSGDTTSHNLKEDDTIAFLKHRIEFVDGPPVRFQRMFLDGDELEDNHTLADCGFQPDSTVFLEMKLIRTS
ncbi:isg15 ubiquitin-like modifier [Stygiomarasmius scandens]|uniref:Isg15 ubiquitin-like modifier n=1 Tax=Marasmiellus scandens TaxID=2682957 RepID=A0ABR1IL18_9AGAR